MINEVESDGLADFIELMNTGGAPVDVSGYVLKDNNDGNTMAIPGGTIIPAGGFLAVDTIVRAGIGRLGASVPCRMATLLDSYSWTAHAAATYGRCPDGTGAFIFNLRSHQGRRQRVPGAGPSHGRAARLSPRSTRQEPSAATSAASTTRAPAPRPRACSGPSTTATAGWIGWCGMAR